MSESVETIAVIFALCATIWLALGLALSQLLRKWPARAHGVLVAAQTGALITPELYLIIQQANWGLLPAREAPTQVSVPSREEPPQSLFEPQPIPTSSREMLQPEPMISRPTEGIPADPVGRFPEIADRINPVQEVPEPISPKVPEVSPPPNFSFKGLVLWAWMGASALMLLRLCLDFLAGYRLAGRSRPLKDACTMGEIAALACKLGLTRAPLLAQSDNIASPVLWAWSRPARILIPIAARAKSATRGVYLHELAHLARRDHLSALLGEIVWCLIPWHPLAWWAKRSMETRAEEACDDWVVASGCQAADYAEELVHLAPSRAGVLTMAAVSKSSRLKSRISRLLQGVFSSPRLGRRWMVGVGVAALLFTGLLSILQPHVVQAGESENEPSQAETEPLLGAPTTQSEIDTTEVFVVAEGKPVAGAKVWLRRLLDTHAALTCDGPLVSDQAGRVQFDVDKRSTFDAMAIDEKNRLGWVYLRRTFGEKPEPILTLEPTATMEGMLVYQGKPAAGVKCKPASVRSKGTPVRGGDFPERFPQGEVRSDEQGKFRVPFVPNGSQVLCEFMDERFAWQRAFLSPGSANPIDLVKGGNLELEFEGPDHPLLPIHYRWYLTAHPSANGKPNLNQVNMNSHAYQENNISIKGNVIPLIEPGKYTIDIRSTATSPYLFKAKQDLEIRPGEITKIKISAKKGIQVVGKIVDPVTGKGVPNYKFSLYSSHELRGNRPKPPEERGPDLREWADGTTDKDGNFEIYVRGKARYGFVYHASHNYIANIDQYRLTGYDRESNTFGVQADIPESGKFTFPELRLAPSQKIAAQVVDKQGRPLNGTIEVFHLVWPSKSDDYMTERELKGGAFEWIGVPSDRPLKLRIRQGKAVNVPVELTSEQWKNGLKITLDEGNAVTFVGQVQDQHGHPVPKTSVGLEWYSLMKQESGPIGQRMMESVETDEQGKFILKGHWPKERYYLHVAKSGYVWPGLESPSLDRGREFDDEDYERSVAYFPSGKRFHFYDMKMGQPGETIDYGIIRLVKDTNVLRGKTLGLDGRPIPGIQVIAAADGAGALQATSGAQGQFEFGQLLEGNSFLIAKGPGYRTTYVSCRAGDSDVAIPMRKTTEPAPPGSAISPLFLAAREKMVRHVLESMWKTRQTNGWGGRMLESMAELDPARAKEWIDQAPSQEKSKWTSYLDKPMTYEEVVRLSLIQVEDGIAATKKMNSERVYHLIAVGEKLLKTNPALTLRFAEEAVIQCRAMGQDQLIGKVAGLAGAGALVWKVGQKENGQKLIQEAIDVLQKDPQNQYFLHCNGTIAASLAPIDWSQAMKRLELCKDPHQYNLALGGCIHQIAKDDPHVAKAKLTLFKEEKGSISSYPVMTRLHVAKRIAETDINGALNLLEGLKNGRAFKYSYAQGLTELAVQVHPKDPARAHKLIDQAFDFLDELERSSSRGNSSRTFATLGAQIVYRAQKIGYPDIQALIARTLGYLGGPPDRGRTFQKDKWRETAFALAFTDPVLAKQVLEKHSPIENLAKEWSGGDAPSQRSHDRRVAGFVLALIDPARTMGAFDSMAAKGWTTEKVSEAGISEIFGSFAKKGDLMKNISEWELLGWIR